jgi:LysR family hydrogen peroxide-inducible transcriptional activator
MAGERRTLREMTMEMHQVRYFLAAAKIRNFTKAAQSCGVSAPSLLRAVGLLEQEFGGALFTRERGNIQLTELGRLALPHLEQISSEAEEAKRRAKTLLDVGRTTLKLGIMCTIAPQHFIQLINGYRQRNPKVALQILDRNAEQLEAALVAGELDVAIYGIPGDISNEKLHIMPLFREQMVVALPPQHALSRGTHVTVAALNGEPYLERTNCEFAQYGEEVFVERGVTGPTIYASERDDWVLAMVAAGMGYSFLPESTATVAGVAVRPLVEPEFWRQVNLATVRGRPHTPAVGSFVREVMRNKWMGGAAISKRELSNQAPAEDDC